MIIITHYILFVNTFFQKILQKISKFSLLLYSTVSYNFSILIIAKKGENMNQKIALAGTPNCGKTTFWNLATGNRGKIGNWPGVTTEKLSAIIKGSPNTELIDLPGIYSLSAKSLEETTTENFLKSGEVDSLIIIIDGTKPEQGLYLAIELLSIGLPAVIGINFADELRSHGISVDVESLSSAVGVPVFLISAKKKENIDTLISAAKTVLEKPQSCFLSISSLERRKESAFLTEKFFRHTSVSTKSKSKESFLSAFLLFVLIPLVFLLKFVLKNYLDMIFERFLIHFSFLLNYLDVSPMLCSLLKEGIISGIFSAFSFVPDLFFLFFLISFLEESGYMARFAFFSDFIFKKFGLSGRSAIPLLLGFGCSVPAIYAAKSSDSEESRSRTLSMLMFAPCSAKLPLSVLICETIFPKFSFCVFLLIYGFVILLGALFSLIKNRYKKSGFVLEIPSVRFPSVKSTLKTSLRRLDSFITKAGVIIVLTNVLIWVLKNFSPFLEPVSLPNESALSAFGAFLSPVFTPSGIPFEGAVALFCGLFAKESALFALLALSDNIPSLFSPVSAVSFLLFFLIYSPCTASLLAIRHEFGAKKAAWFFLRQTAIAYLISFSFYQFALLVQNIFSL